VRLPAARILLVVLGPLAGAGCNEAAISRAEVTARESDSVVRAREESAVRSSPGYVVDSILPVDVELRRFRADLGVAPEGFSFGASSRSALVAAFVRALERNDTTALARLVVNRAEFAYLVYPSSPNVRPPYRQPPDVVWLQRSAATNKAAARLLDRFGGRPLRFAGYSCPAAPVTEGPNTIWGRCVVSRAPAGARDTTVLRMFGPIVAHGGRYKFLSLANGI
jgi:hypothetical protein